MNDASVDYAFDGDDYRYEEEEFEEENALYKEYEERWSKEEVNYVNGKLKSD